MNIYIFYIEDDRYSVPTIDILTADSDSAAQALAIERLTNSPHYTLVEVWAESLRLPPPERRALGAARDRRLEAAPIPVALAQDALV